MRAFSAAISKNATSNWCSANTREIGITFPVKVFPLLLLPGVKKWCQIRFPFAACAPTAFTFSYISSPPPHSLFLSLSLSLSLFVTPTNKSELRFPTGKKYIDWRVYALHLNFRVYSGWTCNFASMLVSGELSRSRGRAIPYLPSFRTSWEYLPVVHGAHACTLRRRFTEFKYTCFFCGTVSNQICMNSMGSLHTRLLINTQSEQIK